MIASVRGEVLEVALDHAVIEAAGSATGSTRRPRRWRRCDAAAKPADHRDDRARGFDDALRFSRQRDPRPVPDVVGGLRVGPKIALATLAVYDTAALRKALADGDVAALTRVPGIGKRGAERMVLELRDKIGPTAAPSAAVNGHAVRRPVVDALVGLGFAVKQAEEATDAVLTSDRAATTASALRAALSLLGKTT
ncbi:holliday junction ATP-dependent DNA helicase ruvA [Mycobacterium xenopi 4042]|uniref:Holliday junction branch migration complex subunit RuvA n=1 Tax=Mycobacterium xenopi 4042 TaxID=1299334 RepID=X8CGX9_MYCXE|nr:holliday junction ATP-dependent DNA helicase ruvA [Mycobacterium xenopi 4042]